MEEEKNPRPMQADGISEEVGEECKSEEELMKMCIITNMMTQ